MATSSYWTIGSSCRCRLTLQSLSRQWRKQSMVRRETKDETGCECCRPWQTGSQASIEASVPPVDILCIPFAGSFSLSCFRHRDRKHPYFMVHDSAGDRNQNTAVPMVELGPCHASRQIGRASCRE